MGLAISGSRITHAVGACKCGGRNDLRHLLGADGHCPVAVQALTTERRASVIEALEASLHTDLDLPPLDRDASPQLPPADEQEEADIAALDLVRESYGKLFDSVLRHQPLTAEEAIPRSPEGDVRWQHLVQLMAASDMPPPPRSAP